MDQIDQVDVVTTENNEAEVETKVDAPEVETKTEDKKPEVQETPQQKKARLERQLKRVNRELGLEDEPKPAPKETKANTGELDDTQQLLLEVKGITADDEVELFQKWKQDTNRQPREILNNKIFQAELTALRQEKATQAATPSSSTRTPASSVTNIDALVDKYERTGELPQDFELRKTIVDKLVGRNATDKPAWRR